MNIPDTTTNVWTPAIERPRIMCVLRRAFFRNLGERWQSYSSIAECWMDSRNNSEWFTKETEDGYFVSLETFNSPNFVMVKEHV